MDCYILGCVLPLNRTIYLRKDCKILGLNINERKTGNFLLRGISKWTLLLRIQPATDNYRKAGEQ